MIRSKAIQTNKQSTTTDTTSITIIIKRWWIILSNFCMMSSWLYVLYILLHPHHSLCSTSTDTSNTNTDTNIVKIALYISFLEVLNALLNITQTKVQHVLLFSIIRYNVECIVSPLIGCNSYQHIITIFFWCIGDTIRFACFLFDSIFDNKSTTLPKYIRYTIGPILFPLGTLGEITMIFAVANNPLISITNRILLYITSLILWPIGFLYLFQRLLQQRQKYIKNITTTRTTSKTPIKVKI